MGVLKKYARKFRKHVANKVLPDLEAFYKEHEADFKVFGERLAWLVTHNAT